MRAHADSLFGISRAGSPSFRDSHRGSQDCCGKWHQNKTSWYAEDPQDGCLLSSWRWTPARTNRTLRMAGTAHGAFTSRTTFPSLPTGWGWLQGNRKTSGDSDCWPGESVPATPRTATPLNESVLLQTAVLVISGTDSSCECLCNADTHRGLSEQLTTYSTSRGAKKAECYRSSELMPAIQQSPRSACSRLGKSLSHTSGTGAHSSPPHSQECQNDKHGGNASWSSLLLTLQWFLSTFRWREGYYKKE